jgi:hypothetical protein
MSDTTAPAQPAGGRPAERDALYNPALIALILAQAATDHEKRSGTGLPFSLAFLVAPIVLHGPTRSALPRQARKKMGEWLELHPVLRAGLARRATSLAPSVRAGVRYGLRGGAVALTDGVLTAPSKPKVKGKNIMLSDEVSDILKQANYVGGWFAMNGTPAAIYALWRVKP